MKSIIKYLSLGLTTLLIFACVGTDYVDNSVEPRLVITNPLQSISVDTAIQLETRFTNNVGTEELTPLTWLSSNPDIAIINEVGIIEPVAKGITTISVQTTYQGAILEDFFNVEVNEITIEEPELDIRTTSLEASSFYTLTGDCELERIDDMLVLRCAENYVADSSLPGLYVYLSNNPNSINNAHTIGAVTNFNGSHEYIIEENIDLFEYSHVLYFCKPFNVKVGDGKLSE